jgi:uncharacterized membrane protein (DUF4010 family)
MDTATTALLVEIGYAAGIGLVVGLEREHADISRGDEREFGKVAMGVRTFALMSLFGWLCAYLGSMWPWMPAVGLATVAALIVAKYLSSGEADRGLTTEVAGAVVYCLGVLVRYERALAVALALLTVLLLVAKPWFREVIPKLKRVELTAALQLLVLLLVVVPLLPAEPVDPWGALRPREIALFVALIAGLSYVGYASSRILGERRGAGVTGLVGGLASSTAVTAAMAQDARATAAMVAPAQVATLVANGVMFARVVAITAVVSSAVAARIAAPMAMMGIVIVVGAAWRWRSMRRVRLDSEPPVTSELRIKNPFAIVPAIKWGAVLSVVLLLAQLAEHHLGSRGLYAAAAASGLADVDAITLAIARQARSSALATQVAAVGVAIAVMSNMLVKGGIAVFAGGWQFGRPIVAIFTIAGALGLLTALAL